jgi:hypothetical protein
MASAPTVSWSPSYYGHPSLKLVWALRTNADGTVERATVTISHYAGVKAFVASAYRSQHRPDPRVDVEVFSPLDMVRLEVGPRVARYSRKAHLAFAASVEERLAAGLIPQALPVFDADTPAV